MPQFRAITKPLCVLSVLALSVAAARANPIDVFSPTEQNLKMMQQAAAVTSIELVDEYGSSPSTLSYTGSFTATSWLLSLTGTLASQTVNFSFTGSTSGPDGSNDSTGSYAETGTVGGDAWSGSGAWSSGPDPSDSTNRLGAWKSSDPVTYGPKPPKPPKPPKVEHDIEVDEEYALPDGVDYIAYHKTINGDPVGPEHYEESDDEDGLGGRSSREDYLGVGVRLNGQRNLDTDTVSGTINIVPLPAAVWSGLALLGALGLMQIPRRMRRLIPASLCIVPHRFDEAMWSARPSVFIENHCSCVRLPVASRGLYAFARGSGGGVLVILGWGMIGWGATNE